MLRCCIKAFCVLGMLLPLSAVADVIHWEVRSVNDPEATDVLGRDFVLTGGFDYDLATGTFSNITLRSSTTDGCVACNDFSDGGTGETYLLPNGQGGVLFSEAYPPDADDLGQWHTLQISGGNSFDDIWAFDVTQPGTYENLDLDHTGYILLRDPLDPDIAESAGCLDCAYAIGTLVPIPEPETYALMLSGIGLLGWQARRKSSEASRHPAVKR